MNELIQLFPRVIGYPEKVVKLTKEEFYTTLNHYNGIKPKLYFGIYNCDENMNYNNCTMHVIFFDIDKGKEKGTYECKDTAKKISQYCFEHDYRHCIIFSTGGFWVYIKTTNGDKIENKKSCLRNSQEKIIQDLNLSVGMDNGEVDIDGHIIGDIKRIGRMPGTHDTSKQLYCQSIPVEWLDKEMNEIRTLCKEQQNKIYWYCTGAFDLKPYDYLSEYERMKMEFYDYDIKCDNTVISKFLPCVQNCILNIPLKSHNKYWVWTTIYLKERWGLGTGQIKKIVKPYLERWLRNDGFGENDWIHYIVHDSLPESVFRDGYYFPKCEVLFQNGYCKGKCKYFNESGFYK